MIPPKDFGMTPTKGKESDVQIRPNLNLHNESEVVKPNLEKLLGGNAPIMRQEDFIGMYHNSSQLSLSCRDVNDLMQVHQGTSERGLFGGSSYACQPIHSMSVLAYDDQRKGFSHDFKQQDKVLVSTYF